MKTAAAIGNLKLEIVDTSVPLGGAALASSSDSGTSPRPGRGDCRPPPHAQVGRERANLVEGVVSNLGPEIGVRIPRQSGQ
jgi:hypothetical protein